MPFALLRPPVDTRAPVLLAARGEPTLDRVFLRFDEALTPASAETVANYALTPAVPIRTATLLANGHDVELSTAPLTADTRHTVRVAGLRDAAGNTVAGEAAFTTVRLVPGAVRREFYDAPNTGANVALTDSPGWPVLPDTVGTLPSFASAPFNSGAEANRALAFLQPTTTATHRLLLYGGTGNTLLFAPPDGPERELAAVSLFDPLQFAFSEPVLLEAGQRYRLELRGSLARFGANFAVNSALASAYDRGVVVELEDYDFDGGQQVTAASAHPYVPGRYTNRLGTPEVDFHVEAGNDNAYRPSDSAQPTLYGPDTLAYHGGVRNPNSYSLQLNRGEWANYTRVFPAGRYRVLLASTVNSFPDFRLGKITAGQGTVAQAVQDLGRFAPDAESRLTRLTDGAGQPIELDLGGLTTLRLTGNDFIFGGYDYLLFIPVADEPSDLKLLLEPSPFNPPLTGSELLAPVNADGTGYLLRETWTGVTAATIAEFRASAAAQQPPNQSTRVNRFELERSLVFGTAVTRLRGWVVPYRSGPHRFFVSASQRAEFFLSPDDQPEHLALAATEPTGTQPARSWFSSASHTRDPIAPENWTPVVNLTAGQRYAVEVWFRHSAFEDHVGVNWFPPGTLQPANGTEPLSGLHLVAPDQP